MDIIVVGIDSLDKTKIQYSQRTCFDILHVLTYFPVDDFIAYRHKKINDKRMHSVSNRQFRVAK